MSHVPQELPRNVVLILRTLRDAANSYTHRVRNNTWTAELEKKRQNAWRDYCGYVLALYEAGWRNATIARAMGVGREADRQMMLKYGKTANPPRDEWPVPWAPRKLPPWGYGPAPHQYFFRRKYLTGAEKADLTRLRRASMGNRGPTYYTGRVDPEVEAGVEFATKVNALLSEGHTLSGIARDLGVTIVAIQSRLARHGFMDYYASQTLEYKRSAREVKKRQREERVGRG